MTKQENYNHIRQVLTEAFPEMLELKHKETRQFHELYEKYAPEFGYETRKDTKEFDPESSNGKLMLKVVSEVTRPPLITDALRWLSPCKLNGLVRGKLVLDDGIEFDLSQPELINQSEKALQALSELMNK